MKLNYKRTVLVGFAFFLISAFWQSYDKIIPLIMTNRFGMSQTASGFIMSLDNILAVFMLPLFGAFSDRVKTPFGRRTPFVFLGTVAAVIFYIVLGMTRAQWLFIVVLLLVLISMATFRSPAVALMPDVTVKPLRSKGNAIINLMGTAGGITVLLVGMLVKTDKNSDVGYLPYIIAVCGVMLVALGVFLLTVKETKWAKEADEAGLLLEPVPVDAPTVEKRPLTRSERSSLILILASVALWYIGYNAVTSKFSVYVEQTFTVIKDGLETVVVSYDTALLVAQAAAAIAFIPVGMVSSKLGRRKTILIGIALLGTAFGVASFLSVSTPTFLLYILFAMAGIGWATINVNSFPMVVELAGHGDVGKFTGYYYTASMAAQIVTPVLSGALIDIFQTWQVFFPYAAVFVGLSFVTMFFVRHGDAKPEKKASLLENFDND